MAVPGPLGAEDLGRISAWCTGSGGGQRPVPLAGMLAAAGGRVESRATKDAAGTGASAGARLHLVRSVSMCCETSPSRSRDL